jgi:hypothetical protein
MQQRVDSPSRGDIPGARRENPGRTAVRFSVSPASGDAGDCCAADPARGEKSCPRVSTPARHRSLLAGLRDARPGPEPYAHVPAELS